MNTATPTPPSPAAGFALQGRELSVGLRRVLMVELVFAEVTAVVA